MTSIFTKGRLRRRAILGLAAAVTPGVGIAAAAPAHAVPVRVQVVQQIGGYLVGASPNFIGVIPSAGVCSWNFSVFQGPTGIVYSALTCWGPLGPTYALVGTNPAVGCNDMAVCDFLEASSIVWQ
jgi:hypothetical protein